MKWLEKRNSTQTKKMTQVDPVVEVIENIDYYKY